MSLMNTEQGKKYLQENTEKLGRAIQMAVSVSKHIQNRFVISKLSWLSVLLIRLCNTSLTIYRILPNNKLASTDYENWDAASIMSLARNFSECYHLFFYLGVENVPEEEWLCRKKILNLHDCVERGKIFDSFDNSGNDFRTPAESIKNELKKNPYFLKLKPAKQKKYLKGTKALLLERTEIEDRIGNIDKKELRLYKFFSQQTHSFPMSFYRMSNEGRGRGIENDVDRLYIAMAADYVSSYLLKAVADTIKIFGDVKAKLPKREIDWLNSLQHADSDQIEPSAFTQKEFTFDVQYKRDNKDLLEQISLTVEKDFSKNKTKYISVTIPNNIAFSNGVFITFGNLIKTRDGKLKTELDKEKPVRIPFQKFNETSCVLHINDCIVDDKGMERMNTFQKILDFDHICFLFTYPDGSHKTVVARLISLKRFFK